MSLTIVPSPETETIHPRDLIDAAECAVMFLAQHARAARFDIKLLANTHDPLSCAITIAAEPAPPHGLWHWTVEITALDGACVALIYSHRHGNASPCLMYHSTAHAARLPAVVERLERLTVPEVA